jgi:hypothetical protein
MSDSYAWKAHKKIKGSKLQSWSLGDASRRESCFATIYTQPGAVSKYRWDVLCMKSHHSTQSACGDEGRAKTLPTAKREAASARQSCRTKTGFLNGLRRRRKSRR